MTTNYRYPAPRFITAADLGCASNEQARRMCELMQAKGWDVRYGNSPNRPARDTGGRELEFPVEAFETDWNAALDVLAQEVAPLNAELDALRARLSPLTLAAIRVLNEALYLEAPNNWHVAMALVIGAHWHPDGALDSALIDARAARPRDPVDVLGARLIVDVYEESKL